MSILEESNFEIKMSKPWKPTMRQIAFEYGLSIKKTSSRKLYRKRFRRAYKSFSIWLNGEYSKYNTDLAMGS